MVHELWTNGDTLAALINVDGAWIDKEKRKIAQPPEICKTCFFQIPKTDDFNI